jgi:hypothetical protein
MKNALPQQKFQIFLDAVEPQLAPAMPALVHPTPCAPLLPQVDSWLKIIGTAEDNETYKIVRAALLILADDLVSAHGIVQNIDTPYAAAWHAVIHRREADFWNSNYWWRRAQGIRWAGLAEQLVPLLKPHGSSLQDLCAPTYSPAAFTDAVERHHRDPALAPTLAEIQRLEWKSLLEATLQRL